MCCVFFFNDTATTEIYTLSLHDALPISRGGGGEERPALRTGAPAVQQRAGLRPGPGLEGGAGDGALRAGTHLGAARRTGDRKSTRLNSSHANISYAVFCLKKKNQL